MSIMSDHHTEPNPHDHDVDRVRMDVASMICQHPTAIHHVPFTYEVVSHDPTNLPRRIVHAAQRLIRATPSMHATIQNIAAESGIALVELEMYANRVTDAMERDWQASLHILQLAHVRRALVETYNRHACEVLSVPTLRLPAVIAQQQTEVAVITATSSVREVRTDAKNILRQYLDAADGADGMMMGFRDLDFALRGGVYPGEIWAIGGSEKMRKTTLMRNVLLALAENGHPVAHIALDGGVSETHMLHYVGMIAMRLCISEGLDVYTPNIYNGLPASMLEAKNLDRYLDALKPNRTKLREPYAPVSPRVGEVIAHAIDDLLRLTTFDLLHIIDSRVAGDGLDALVREMRRLQVACGTKVMALDHIGRISVAKKDGAFDHIRQSAAGLASFCAVHGVAGIVVSQRNTAGAREQHHDGGMDSTYEGNFEGGRDLLRHCQAATVTAYDEQTHRLALYFIRNRNGAANRSTPDVEYDLDPATGLFGSTHGFDPVEGY